MLLGLTRVGGIPVLDADNMFAILGENTFRNNDPDLVEK